MLHRLSYILTLTISYHIVTLSDFKYMFSVICGVRTCRYTHDALLSACWNNVDQSASSSTVICNKHVRLSSNIIKLAAF
ncbi:hypothetical protein PAHAL_5G208100 [Panicum hallii]|uniref:Uncharacterized protein n=1 Tax=Panicum hallii TaxID=206008 RepID=A0A2T8IKP0_9POAL|nr:hypothetical protein PAHAL_5G208100 [Panicum hallii]